MLSLLRRLARCVAVMLAGFSLPGSATAEPTADRLDQAAVARLIRAVAPRVADANGWASDLLASLDALRFDADRDNVCAVVAIIRQESGFVANPRVPGLGPMAAKAAQAEIAGSFKYTAYFATHPQVRTTFLDRLGRATTERDLDLAYRWLSGVVRQDWAFTSYLRFANAGTTMDAYLEANNKIRTIGSMQVAVKFAAQASRIILSDPIYQQKLHALRDLMYTRRGGIHFGAMQLLGYRADYSSRLFLFADYNSGRYSSRNAAVQLMAATLSGTSLHLDGDLLAYGKAAQDSASSETEAAINRVFERHGIADPARVREDLLQEKTRGFTETRTYRTLRTLYEQRTRRSAPYAIVPRIDLESVKIKRRMTTAIFAGAVDRHYRICWAQAGLRP